MSKDNLYIILTVNMIYRPYLQKYLAKSLVFLHTHIARLVRD